jgi:putative hydrolase of the HAD superfamily
VTKPVRLRAVFLDLDDTLCDSEGLTPLRLEAVRAALDGETPSDQLNAVLQEALTWDPLGLPGQPPNRIQRLGDRLGLSDEQRQRMRTVYNRTLMDNLCLHEGAEEALAWLRQRVALGLITNGPSEFQRGKIARLGIERYFDSITISGEVGKHKPDPEIFHVALKSLDVRPEEALYVGDRPEADIAGARAVGITAVLVRNRYPFPVAQSAEPDYIVESVAELPRLLVSQGWLAGEASDLRDGAGGGVGRGER